MLSRFKTALYTVVGGPEMSVGSNGESSGGSGDGNRTNLKFPYKRPAFLQFATEEEMLVSEDHQIRPIIVPRDLTKLPWKGGYAETINAGKSLRNEDQATVHIGILRKTTNENGEDIPYNPQDPFLSLPYVYFGMFDGHAGTGASVAASNTLHHIIHEKLTSIVHLLLPSRTEKQENLNNDSDYNIRNFFQEKEISPDSLIVGALETAFWDMDLMIEQDRLKYRMTGGCTAVAALFIMGKLFIANAGDSRCIICRGNKVIPMSHDFTPETEQKRIRNLALVKPQLLGDDYTALEFCRRPLRKDIGKRMLYRDAYMTGWAYKTVTHEDLKFPLVYGEGKRSRVLATIGVTRGFGDHDLKAQSSNLNIKPFLTPQPEVCIYNVATVELTPNDVLIIASDGLWDITSNEKAAEIVQKTFEHFSEPSDIQYRYRYASAAQELVMHSRGKLVDRNWRTASGKQATIDDISVFVVPLLPYQEEYNQWQEARRFITETVANANSNGDAASSSASTELSSVQIAQQS
ncbi:hypothetical protein CHUAL_005097 [Chamberlinius hualienensis]